MDFPLFLYNISLYIVESVFIGNSNALYIHNLTSNYLSFLSFYLYEYLSISINVFDLILNAKFDVGHTKVLK